MPQRGQAGKLWAQPGQAGKPDLREFADRSIHVRGANASHVQRHGHNARLRYLCGERVDELLAQEDVTKSMSAAERVLWQVVDHLGTVRALVKQDGTAATKFVYDAFGGIISRDTSLTRYLFTSREFDADTGFQYSRARWYDANVGRWISEDPLGFAAGDVNTARYVGNGVVAWVDTSGRRRS